MGEKGAPAAGPTGTEAGPGAKPGKAAGQTDQAKPGPAGKAAEDKARPGAAEGTAETKEKAPTAGEEKAPAATKDKAATQEKPKTTEEKATTEEKPGAAAKGEAELEGKAGTSVKLGSEQVSKVKTHFAEHKPNVKSVSKTEVSVSVGVAVPAAVVLYDLPPDIIVVEGGCSIKYFLWDEDIVLVDSCTRAVVEIIVIA
jgi:hypothetical protein